MEKGRLSKSLFQPRKNSLGQEFTRDKKEVDYGGEQAGDRSDLIRDTN